MIIENGAVVKVNKNYDGLRGHMYHGCIGEVVSSRQLPSGATIYGVVIYLDHATLHRYMRDTEIDVLLPS